MSLICLFVYEGTGSCSECIEDAMNRENSRHRRITSYKTFADTLNVRNDVFLLPCVSGSSPAHATHDFVED